MHSRMTFSMLALMTASNAAGCYSTWDIEPRTLLKLNGFRAGQTVELPTSDGKTVNFNADSTVHLEGNDGIETDAQLGVVVTHHSLLLAKTIPDAQTLNVDLGRLSRVQIVNSSSEKTGLLVTGGVLGAVSGALGGFIWLYANYYQGPSGRPLRLPNQTAPIRAPLGLARIPRHPPARRADARTRARLFTHWAREASAECASIPAFLALARDLARASAPSHLVYAALRAAREEATHTRFCVALANEHAELPIAAFTPAIPQAMDIDAQRLLERLVLEAFWDGCVAEGGAAAVARRSMSQTKNELARKTLQTIARDEQGHADLARDIVAFGLSVGGPAVRRALAESFERRRADEESLLNEGAGSTEGPGDEDVLHENGLAGHDIQHRARIETWEKSVSMLEALGCG
ncbi:MAG TPA: hypothetical protein PK156_36640 [Polyangium sp.]|nr:hypothetical protein [Polyangium sp.]